MTSRRAFLKTAASGGALARAAFGAQRKAAPAGAEWDGEVHRDVCYKQVGGAKVLMDIYLPRERKSPRAPVMYFVHGGGWAKGNKSAGPRSHNTLVFKELAPSGFVCVSIDYRLVAPGNGVFVRDCVVDAKDGLRFLRKSAGEYRIDPARMVVWGASAGGHIIQMLTLAGPDDFAGDESLAKYGVQPAAGVSWFGPTDFTDASLFRAEGGAAQRFAALIEPNGRSYEQNPKAYEEVSPYYWLKKTSPPLMLMQGDHDALVPMAHATHLKKKADQIGAKVDMLIVKNAGHSWQPAGGDPQPSVAQIQHMTAEAARKYLKLTA